MKFYKIDRSIYIIQIFLKIWQIHWLLKTIRFLRICLTFKRIRKICLESIKKFHRKLSNFARSKIKKVNLKSIIHPFWEFLPNGHSSYMRNYKKLMTIFDLEYINSRIILRLYDFAAWNKSNSFTQLHWNKNVELMNTFKISKTKTKFYRVLSWWKIYLENI